MLEVVVWLLSAGWAAGANLAAPTSKQYKKAAKPPAWWANWQLGDYVWCRSYLSKSVLVELGNS